MTSGDKFRLRFRKTGVLRLLSHHDLMRCCERMLRRADIPFRMTGGFHPTPRLVFALSLPLGVEGLREVVELETIREFDSADILSRLQKQAPTGLEFLSIQAIPSHRNAVPRRAIYQVEIADSEVELARERIPRLLAEPKLWVDRIRPKPRALNIRPYIRDILLSGPPLTLDIWVTGTGSAKADELLRLLELHETLASGRPIQRIDLELHDETPSHSVDHPPTDPPEHRPLARPLAAHTEPDSAAEPGWGLSPNGPVVE